MTEQNQSTDSLKDLRDIRQMMERSSRFISLSGFSGIVAGLWALVGAVLAKYWLFEDYYNQYEHRGSFNGADFARLKLDVLLLASAVMAAAFLSAFYFTWRKTRREGHSIWNPSSRRLFWNTVIPLGVGGLFILSLLQYNDWRFIAPACLVFYGLALINASKYTLTDIKYLGYCEIVLGLVNMQWIGYGLYFWALGFGVLHIAYGIVMWWKYERKSQVI
jgi:hypothetical protein